MGQRIFLEEGGTGILVLQIIEALFGTGKIIILDSVFCVIKYVIELKKRGVYASVLINKIIYFPKFINGELIKLYMVDK